MYLGHHDNPSFHEELLLRTKLRELKENLIKLFGWGYLQLFKAHLWVGVPF